MYTYFIYALVYVNMCNDVYDAQNVNIEDYPIQLWYPMLWKNKVPFNFYQVQNYFVIEFKKMVFGQNTRRLSNEVQTFLPRKGIF